MKNSLTRKLLLAVITLGIAVIATVGSTYAWFSMNTTVEATGMQLTATTPVNVVISKNASNGFSNSVEFDTTSAWLLPASTDTSTINSSGFTFYAVREGQVIGSNGEGGQVTTGSEGTLFQDDLEITDDTADGQGRQYLIVEDLYLKTTAGKISLVLESIDLGNTTMETSSGTIDSAATVEATTYEIKKALYVALITDHATYVYAVDGNNDSVKGVASVQSGGTWTEAASARTLSEVNSTKIFTYNVAGQELGTTAEHVKVLVWLEGEDPDCVNAIGGLGLSLGLTFAYVNGEFAAE